MAAPMIDSLKELIRNENKKFCEEVATFVEYSLNNAKKKLTEEIIKLLPPVTESSGQMPSVRSSTGSEPDVTETNGRSGINMAGEPTGSEHPQSLPRKPSPRELSTRIRLSETSDFDPMMPVMEGRQPSLQEESQTPPVTSGERQLEGSTEIVAARIWRTDEQKRKRKERESTTEGSAKKKRYDQLYYERVKKPKMLAKKLAKGK